MTDLPMLAIASSGASGRPKYDLTRLLETGDWMADVKLDGVRAYLMPDGKILNRRGTDVTYKFPEIENPADFWLDGEIVALDGTFETTLLRESQESKATIKRMTETRPVRFVAFDMPGLGSLPWRQRREELIHLHAGVSVTPVSQDPGFYGDVVSLGMEGVIAKRMNARYQHGKRSADWVKFRHSIRISCIASGYTPGQGSRSHFGAMHLALIKDGDVVQIGRTGSGFTERQTHELKARLDAGEFFVVEIEAANRTSGDQLRFPVFRGVRTDVSMSDCTYDQLDQLTRC